MLRTIQTLSVRDLMNDTPLLLQPSMGLHRALGLLLDHQVIAAPVVSEGNILVGFVSEQDILRELWANDFDFDIERCIGDIMRDDIVSVTPQDTIDSLAAYMVFDPNKLFEEKTKAPERIPGNFSDDLARAQVCRPKLYPVVDNGIVLGTIDRHQLLKALHHLAKRSRMEQSFESHNE
ncbi:CBS domain-containing protein [Celerinatantimonas sp. YJH-8]|uniref:CBS domain-containing protein n=1 Tax=Celerinatantimonas sp. YJH-8 TaxID=3228714 RepID=UPI0038C6B513